jgi:hypothetical protein
MKNTSFIKQKSNVLLLIICLFSMSLFAQENSFKQKSDFWSHVLYGGGIGLSFGNEFFSGTLAPSAIYQFNPKFALGVALSGSYSTQKYYYKSSIFGGSILGLYNPISQLQLSASFDENFVSVNWDNRTGYANQDYWYPSLFLGAGYQAKNVTMGIRFDVLYDNTKSTYAEPWMPFVRVYF